MTLCNTCYKFLFLITDSIYKIEALLRKVDLYDSRQTYAKNLSGGQKRKLSIAIALIGDPKVLALIKPTFFIVYNLFMIFIKIIILDEPSSGMVSKNVFKY